jgi:hypothetical protein
MLRPLLFLASFLNCAGGLVLILTWLSRPQRVPIIVLFIGVSLLIQGGYTILYLRGSLDRWGDLATGALFAGEGLSACVGAGGLILGIIHNMNDADMEMVPVLAGAIMLAQAVVALLFLLTAHRLRPQLGTRTPV